LIVIVPALQYFYSLIKNFQSSRYIEPGERVLSCKSDLSEIHLNCFAFYGLDILFLPNQSAVKTGQPRKYNFKQVVSNSSNATG